jgi:hypothetical protein
MKKILTVAGCLAFGAMSYGQGVVVFNSNNLGVLTNTAVSQYNGGNQTGGTSGKTAITAGGFYYALFVQTYTGSLSSSATNPVANGWSLATSSGTPIIATNGTSGPQTGSILGPGGVGGVAIDGLALPSGGTYDTSGRDYFLIVGWSSSLGSSWSQVQNQLLSGNWLANGFFGVSAIGNTYAGGANSLTPQTLFSSNAQTIAGVGAFTLYSVSPVPEPSTLVLAGLGGLSLLAFRRKK